MSSTFTVQLNSDAATALRKLDGQLIADDVCLEDVLRYNLARAADHLGEIAESDIDPCDSACHTYLVELRELTSRLDSIVSVYEAITTDRERVEDPVA